MISSKGRIDFDGRDIDELSFNEMRPLRREMQIVFQDPFGSLSPRMSVAEIIEEGLEDPRAVAVGSKSATQRVVDGARRRSASIRRPASAIRTNSPAASASASRSPAPWC